MTIAGFILMFFALLGNLTDLAYAPFVAIAYLLTGTKMLLGLTLRSHRVNVTCGGEPPCCLNKKSVLSGY